MLKFAIAGGLTGLYAVACVRVDLFRRFRVIVGFALGLLLGILFAGQAEGAALYILMSMGIVLSISLRRRRGFFIE